VTRGAKKWMMTLIKLTVCAIAVWYLSGKVTINDYARLEDSPKVRHLLISETGDSLVIREEASHQERRVSRSALAGQEQLGRNERPIEYGLRYVLRSTRWSWAWWAFMGMSPATFVIAWRLRLLLSTQNISISRRDAILLSFAGNFFNFAMPGTTGGDLYKAYHIAKQTHKRAEGVTIVFMDRVIGLISFLLLATVAIFVSWGKDIVGVYGKWVGYLMVAFIVSCCLFFSLHIRRWIRYDQLLQKLPFGDKLRRIDETVFNFRYHPGKTILAVSVSIGLHLLCVVTLYCLARGLGVDPGPRRSYGDLYLACLLCFVVGYLFAAVPISFQGIGILEAVFIRVLVTGEWCSMNQMIAMTMGIRIIQIIWALPGLVVPWLGFRRPPGQTAEEALDAAEASPDVGAIVGPEGPSMQAGQ
jgi:glycosyltransferase 2 family protein